MFEKEQCILFVAVILRGIPSTSRAYLRVIKSSIVIVLLKSFFRTLKDEIYDPITYVGPTLGGHFQRF
jgi:hypothetical protein